jgi:hypothetical protein
MHLVQPQKRCSSSVGMPAFNNFLFDKQANLGFANGFVSSFSNKLKIAKLSISKLFIKLELDRQQEHLFQPK